MNVINRYRLDLIYLIRLESATYCVTVGRLKIYFVRVFYYMWVPSFDTILMFFPSLSSLAKLIPELLSFLGVS